MSVERIISELADSIKERIKEWDSLTELGLAHINGIVDAMNTILYVAIEELDDKNMTKKG